MGEGSAQVPLAVTSPRVRVRRATLPALVLLLVFATVTVAATLRPPSEPLLSVVVAVGVAGAAAAFFWAAHRARPWPGTRAVGRVRLGMAFFAAILTLLLGLDHLMSFILPTARQPWDLPLRMASAGFMSTFQVLYLWSSEPD